ncbi:MAG: alanine:cation symporter family protein, partial [bacterium]
MLQQLLKPYQQYGNLHYGEGVTELAHALQAAQLAHEAGENESLIAAGDSTPGGDIVETIAVEGHEGEVSHFQALTAALSATVGLGNIAGVAIAVSIGG